MNIAYVRVSSVTQNEDRQIKELEKHDIKRWYTEKVSAKDTKRPKYLEMLDFAREGDTIYILDFSRIARNTKDLLELIEDLELRKIRLISIKENIDTSTPSGKLMVTMIAAINQFERENLLERQREGIAIAKAKGKYKGRKRIEKPDNWNEIYNKWKVREITGTKAMQLLGLKRNTFYKFVKDDEDIKLKL